MDSSQLKLAMEAISNGQSIRETAKQFHVSKDYLWRHLNGQPTRDESNVMRHSLSPYQEQQLVNWCCCRRGWAGHHLTVDFGYMPNAYPSFRIVEPPRQALAPSFFPSPSRGEVHPSHPNRLFAPK